MSNHLLFQAYAPQQIAQCRYFLLKYLGLYNLKPPAGTTVIVYTNNPVAFEGFINFFTRFEMPEMLLNAAVGTLTRTAVLQQAFLQYNGNMLYCDAATYPVQPLEHLFADMERGTVYLHAPRRHKESELNAALRRLSAHRDKTTVITASPQARINIWHTAVIGITDKNKGLLEHVATQEAASQSSLASDYAYTNVFSGGGKVKSAAKYIFEYGDLKEFTQLLETFFAKNEEESIPNQVKAVHHIDAAAIQQQRERFRRQPLFKKWLSTITGKRWSIQQYISKL